MELKELVQAFIDCGEMDPLNFDEKYPEIVSKVDLMDIYQVNAFFIEAFKNVLKNEINNS